MRCPSCGTEPPPKATFCGACGAKLDAVAATLPSQRSRKPVVLLVGLLILICAAVVSGTAVLKLHGKQGSGSVIAASQAPKRYTVTDFGDFSPIAINNSGQVAGVKGMSAAIWRDGQVTLLSPSSGYPGVVGSDVYENNSGDVLFVQTGGWPWLWKNGHLAKLTDQPEVANLLNVNCSFLNDNDQMLCTGNLGGGVYSYSNGQLVLKRALQGAWFRPVAMNNDAVLVGIIDTPVRLEPPVEPATFHAAMLKDERIVNLSSPPADSAPEAINNSEQIVGEMYIGHDAKSSALATLWQNGQTIDLGKLPGGHNSEAKAINNTGQIVGSSDTRAVLWNNRKISDLNSLVPPEYTLKLARAINDKGQILGEGTHSGKEGWFLLTPR